MSVLYPAFKKASDTAAVKYSTVKPLVPKVMAYVQQIMSRVQGVVNTSGPEVTPELRQQILSAVQNVLSNSSAGVTPDYARIDPDDAGFQEAAKEIVDCALESIDTSKYMSQVPGLLASADAVCGKAVDVQAFEKYGKAPFSSKGRDSAPDLINPFNMLEVWKKNNAR
ncbi:hypothetical protein [Streptomyces ehimensis]|uniref:Uncharacterized protein n=1 Tax=Streptomyces ehimensis TaxID=68195 RepID=A0ABV9BTE2_9ACTN